MNTWNKVEELVDLVKSREMKDLITHKEDQKSKNIVLWVLAIIGAVAAVAAIAYAVYRYMTPDYMEDFEDDFDDDFDDDFFEDEDEELVPIPEEAEEVIEDAVDALTE